jgi:hypothetical protein
MYSLSRYQHGTRRHLARQAQRTAEDARALVELAAFAVEAEQGRKIEREAHEDMPAEYGGEEQAPEQSEKEATRVEHKAKIPKTDDKVQDTSMTLATSVKKETAKKMLPLNRRVKNTTRLHQLTRRINLLQKTGQIL